MQTLRKLITYTFLLLCFYQSWAQDSTSTRIYGSPLDDRVEDAELLPTGEVLVIGNSYSDVGDSHPFVFTVDSNLNISDYSELYSQLSARLSMIIKQDERLFLIASFKKSAITDMILLLEVQNDLSYKIIDSIRIDFTYPAIRNYRIHNDNVYIIGDGAPQNNPGENKVFIITFNLKLKKLSISEVSLPGYRFAFDVFCNTDSSLTITTMGFQAGQALSNVEICYLSNKLNIDHCSQLPFSMILNTDILSVNDSNIILSGFKSNPNIDTFSDDQLIASSFKINADTLYLIDSLQFGKAHIDEIPAYRGVSGADKYYYISGTSDYDAESYPFSNFENRYITASFDKSFKKRFTKYIGLKNNHLFLTKTVLINEERNVLLVGTAFDFQNNAAEPQRDIYIVKLDSLGNIATGLPPGLLPAEDFLLFPNPGTDYLDISLPNAARGRFSLFDIQGRLIIRQRFEQRLRIPTAKLPAGIYIYRIRDDKNRTQHGKWVKQ